MKNESLHTEVNGNIENAELQNATSNLIDFFELLIEADIENKEQDRFSIMENHLKDK